MTDQLEERWLTYDEVGKALGISAQAARMLAKRRGWPRRTPNAYGERARVLVPDAAAVQPRTPTEQGTFADHMIRGPNGSDQATVRAIEQAIEALREQLVVANGRADRAELRVDELLVALADARTAAMISSSDAAALRAQLELLTARRPWWRRWFR